MALDGDVDEGAWCAWLTLEPDASVSELEAAAEASRVALRLESKSRGARALPLRSGLDETLSVLGRGLPNGVPLDGKLDEAIDERERVLERVGARRDVELA